MGGIEPVVRIARSEWRRGHEFEHLREQEDAEPEDAGDGRRPTSPGNPSQQVAGEHQEEWGRYEVTVERGRRGEHEGGQSSAGVRSLDEPCGTPQGCQAQEDEQRVRARLLAIPHVERRDRKQQRAHQRGAFSQLCADPGVQDWNAQRAGQSGRQP
jgi:hypothetical protein